MLFGAISLTFLALVTNVLGDNTCVLFSTVVSFYVIVQIDSNGDVCALGTGLGSPQIFSTLSLCQSESTAGKVISVSCGCDLLSITSGGMSGYDQGPMFWCNSGKTALGANPPNPNCTPPPPPTTTTVVPPTTTRPPTSTPVVHAACSY
ncbi:Aste57867_8341 [Aphanomyces stellatus]|uniref:Aste57867_8341 protein n=1 Tax=Aphanomyces stellatus TaxID=120398 RepID=A0A485KJZ7_9STRA|nr:hypothetical protein As57867_008309 [Aphanomyces stellatus]VFT85228.1 Aste57867_8341 [Aphanomyces stellatus]